MDSVQMIAHIEKSLDYSLFDVKWIPCSAKFVVLGSKPKGTGIIQVYQLNSGELDKLHETEKPKSFKCCSFGASQLRETQLATGDFVGKLAIYDVERLDEAIYEAEAHAGIINAIDAIGGTSVNCGAQEIVTGGRDGSVKVWDPRQKNDPVAHISATGNSPAEIRDCWAVGFGDSYNCIERSVVAGYDNGDVKLIDLRVMKERWTTNVKNGVCGIEFDRKDIKMNKLVVSTLEGGLHVFDMRTQHSEKGFARLSEKNVGQALGTNGVINGAKSTVWVVKHLPQNRDIFATCGGSGNVRLWLYHYPETRVKTLNSGEQQGVVGSLEMLNATTLSTQPVHAFDWSPDRQGLAVCGSFDQTVRVLVTTNLHLH
ncbi:dynein axonemal assembly factor 10 [Wyeomyia smithii]|uniref:dynein axonemal assembly factor 10 n=1 Tax=Wyeomyia smithii TaxID=174621 RepID=UPI002467C5C5|nr:dynein axonemal assembly factor 10 [Wyeomyia smithii]XP_055532184.1 dynein axonemal assembly factor 10 [Wyeomyia smithii]